MRTASLSALSALPVLPRRSGVSLSRWLTVHGLACATAGAWGYAVAADSATLAEEPHAAPITSVTVAGARRVSTVGNGALGDSSVLELPQSATVVGRDDLADRQVNSLGQVFAGDASVGAQGNTYTLLSSHLSVRGLPLDESNSYKINGLSIYNFGIELPLQFFDQVQLLKGATGFMYGFGAPGGIVNYVTAKPTGRNSVQADIGFRSSHIWSQHLDANGVIGADAALAYRVNLLNEEGDARSGAHVDNKAAAVSLAAQLAPGLRWSGDAIYQRRKTSGTVQGIGTAYLKDSVLPAAPDGAARLPATEGNFFNTDYLLLSTGLQWQLASDWRASVDVSHSTNKRRFVSDWVFPTRQNGDYDNWMNDSESRNRFNQAQLLVQGTLQTGALRHRIVVGASSQEQVNYGNRNAVWQYTGSSNLYGGASLPYQSTAVPSIYRTATFRQDAVFISDTLQLAERWSLLAGARYTDYQQRGYTASGQRSASYGATPVTPTLALIYRPDPGATVYLSHVQSLEQGATVGAAYANRDAVLAPLKSRQYEAGVKLERSGWDAAAALFEVQRGAAYANSANVYVQDGEARYRGLDLNGRVRASRDLSLSASAVWLQAEYREASPAIVGKRVQGTARLQGAIQADYRLAAVPGLSLNGSARHTGEQTVNASGTPLLPAVNLLGAGIKYQWTQGGHDLTLRATLDNLANRSYWYYTQSGYVHNGDARGLSVNLAGAW